MTELPITQEHILDRRGGKLYLRWVEFLTTEKYAFWIDRKSFRVRLLYLERPGEYFEISQEVFMEHPVKQWLQQVIPYHPETFPGLVLLIETTRWHWSQGHFTHDDEGRREDRQDPDLNSLARLKLIQDMISDEVAKEPITPLKVMVKLCPKCKTPVLVIEGRMQGSLTFWTGPEGEPMLTPHAEDCELKGKALD